VRADRLEATSSRWAVFHTGAALRLSPPSLGDNHANTANRELLQPAYDILARHIRRAAPDALIFFSGAIGDRTPPPCCCCAVVP